MTYVNGEQARAHAEGGVLVGKMLPRQDTKWLGWDVYEKNGRLVACVVGEGILCGEEITRDQLPAYTDSRE